ncbi:MFS transporter [Fodinicola acaciae]|uniref:MFS transporter n=1 Tax=Fodinicola acaciae TaxID=2681555 RepID=UPI0013D01B4E|nr:MFS transporter [Fodinicola acaciae]
MRKWIPLVAVCLGTFMLLLDVTIVIVALPRMAAALHTPLSGLQWVIDAYALVLASLLLTAGSLADRAGRRRVFVAGLGIFALGSLGCGLAPTVWLLVAARALQGIGGATMFATTLSLIGATYHGRDRGTALSVWSAVAGAAAAIGPLAGGVITETVGWRWIFLVNLPVCAIAVALVLTSMTESRLAHRGRLDIGGMVALVVAASATTYAIIAGGEDGGLSVRTLASLAVAAAGLGALVWWENRASDPMLDLRLFRRPAFVGVLVAGVALQAGAFTVLPYTSVWLQSVLGLSALQAGLIQFPLSVMSFVVPLAFGRWLHRFPHRDVIAVALLAVAAGAFGQAVISGGSAAWVILPGSLLVGVGVGMVGPVLAGAALAAAPPERAGVAGAAMNTFRQLGLALGVAVLGSVTAAGMAGALTGRVSDPLAVAQRLSSGTAETSVGGQLLREAFAAGLDAAYLVAGAVAAVGALAVFLLMRAKVSRAYASDSDIPEVPRSAAAPRS